MSTTRRPSEWLHPNDHLTAGIELNVQYLGSVDIGKLADAGNDTQEAVLQIARRVFAEDAASKLPVKLQDAVCDISVGEVSVVVDGTPKCRYELDLIPFASCDSDNPRMMYFVSTCRKTPRTSTLHLLYAENAQKGLEYTFTIAQAFSLRWEQTKSDGPTKEVAKTIDPPLELGIRFDGAESNYALCDASSKASSRQPGATDCSVDSGIIASSPEELDDYCSNAGYFEVCGNDVSEQDASEQNASEEDTSDDIEL